MTIILPVYNAGPALDQALERLDRTRPASSEVLIIDDGSTDDTPTRIARFAVDRSYVRHLFLSQNEGVASARNRAVEMATGEYVWFVDWDDDWDKDILHRLHSRARETAADIVVCRTTWRLDSGLDIGHPETLNGDIAGGGSHVLERILTGELKGYLWSKLIRRDLLPTNMFPLQKSQSDFCGVVPVLVRARSIAFEPQTLYHHIIRDGSITNSPDPDLSNLTKCRDVVHDVTSSLAPSPRLEQLLLHYDYAFWYLSRVNTALRLSSPAIARKEVAAVATSMKWREIATIWPISRRTASKSLGVKLLRSRYATSRAIYVSVRRKVRALRGRISL